VVRSITSNSNLKGQALPNNQYTSTANKQLSIPIWLRKWCHKIDRCLIMLSQQITQSKTARERMLFKQATAQWSQETINSGSHPTTIPDFPRPYWAIWWPICPSRPPRGLNNSINRVFLQSSFSITPIWRQELSIIPGWVRRGPISRGPTSRCSPMTLQHLVRIINRLPPNVDQAPFKASKGLLIKITSIPYSSRNKCP
jgi:hypothetical protein